MPDFLTRVVYERSDLPSGYRENAAWQSMQTYLDDWTAARARLDRQIAELTVMVERRQQQVRKGEWPAETACAERPTEPEQNGRSEP